MGSLRWGRAAGSPGAVNAARSANAKANSHYYALDLPATSERIRMGCADDITSLCINPNAAMNAETAASESFMEFKPKGSW